MSSILDALNKLEDDRELAREQEELQPEDVNAQEAADEMIGRDVMRDKVTMQVNPVMLVGGGLAFLTIVAIVVAVSVTLVLKPDAPVTTSTLASIPAETSPTPAVPESDTIPIAEQPSPTPTEIPEEATKPNEVLEVSATQIAEVPEELTSLPPTPDPVVNESPQIIDEQPEPAPTEFVEPPFIEPTPAPPVLQPVAIPIERIEIAKKPEVRLPAPKPDLVVEVVAAVEKPIVVQKPVETEINVRSLAPIDPGVLGKYGLNDFLINMVKPKSDRNPYGSAVINGKKVFEDGYIGGSMVRLKKVVDEGIAIEITRTGEMFFMEY